MKSYIFMTTFVLYVFCCVIAKEEGLCAEKLINQTVAKDKQGLLIEKEQKVQVIFYSRTGKTKTVAKTISETLVCDMQEIKDLKDRSGIRGFISGMIDVRKKPITAISPKVVVLKDYDLLFIGSPIWGMKFAPAITTFLNSTNYFFSISFN